MREYSVPPLVESPLKTNTTDLLLEQAAKPSNPALFSVRSGDTWTPITATEFLKDVQALAKGFAASGIKVGDRVGIMARTRYEWTLVDFALWYTGAVSVPIYETSSPAQVAWILSDSGAVGVVVEAARHENIVRQAANEEDLDAVRDVWQIDGPGLDDLRAAGATVSDEELEVRRSTATLEDTATIIYTSGTTGRPKGCELTHGNFVNLSRNAAAAQPEVAREGAQTIMFLPLAHVFARFISVLCVAAGSTVAHTPDVKGLLPDLQSFRPDFILVVPRVFEKVYNSSMLKAEDGGKGKIFHAGAATAIAWSKAQETGKVPLSLKIKHAVFDKLLYGKIRDAMGGRVKFAISGGAPLGERLGHFFHGIGVVVLEGYGLTETTAPISVNTPQLIKIGTVGAPLPGNAVKIADDGEILTKGVSVMKGYYNRPDLTEANFEDGWFRTGDIGQLDSDGFLKITGRKKEIIVTASGKNVIPAVMEDSIRADAIVSQCVVVGDQKPFISALITIDEEALPGWLERHKLPATTTVAEAAQTEQLQSEIQALVDRANKTVSQAEAIKVFRVVPSDFTEASGHLTPSLKIKRAQVLKDFSAVVDDIYSGQKV
ncbi:long-chain fatty acid--CoA ligase [Arthrobacter sp. zg-ZUI100]|uniref:Acyl-CoA synthetase n=1 Tax=Arthrobacter jiangjiafuii TaxID=2817475 RepID=A0A975M7G2_9MICC|nr:AMP-dependent synthetase/ligase [Arthrobacter jiangjiafuii]MBP3036871.1 long-chain fatty acid--CoA ligase [Arthrobacter jiangjiafuii]MBP3044243.1 long-chain fatty acid--CoA ligase [Arthrobacter jiangjiafuii]QWC11205.1 AMP-dependent synthetase/ligase [Arthrobacter jiangjiafuii]